VILLNRLDCETLDIRKTVVLQIKKYVSVDPKLKGGEG